MVKYLILWENDQVENKNLQRTLLVKIPTFLAKFFPINFQILGLLGEILLY